MSLAVRESVEPLTIKSMLTDLVLAQRRGESCLPHGLGLTTKALKQCLHFINQEALALSVASDTDDIRAELLALRQQEHEDVTALLMKYRHIEDDMHTWLANIVAAGCMGSEHLWRDLGFAERQGLTQLFEQFFPELAQQNNANMRWKKFLYKQLCEAEGHYVCRSPSCETCKSFDECFGEER